MQFLSSQVSAALVPTDRMDTLDSDATGVRGTDYVTREDRTVMGG
jgi:hypothetical protein